MQADIGLVGLAVMGQNLALNINDHGFTVAVFNRTTSKVDEFLQGPAKATRIIATHSLEEMIGKLKKPRKILLMVKAGAAVDELIDEALPFLEKGDLLIDGGNSLFIDTTCRCQKLKEKGILFIGSGISGGEEGARHGPSLMPGGDFQAWPSIKEIFQSIAAKVEGGQPCCDWVGEEGAGHYVKMVHNGIEYGDMQLICEAYHLLKELLGATTKELQEIFASWNRGKLNSYLIEITAQILGHLDKDGNPLVNKILDVAGQKGTGKWTVINASELGVPLTLIGEALFVRFLSTIKEERLEANRTLQGPACKSFEGNRQTFIDAVRDALYASKIISYTQGFMLMRQAAEEYHWHFNYGGIALMWRGGCIIRSRFLNNIKEAFDKNANIKNLLLDDFFKKEIDQAQQGWRQVISIGAQQGIPLPCMSTALAFYDGYRSARLPTYLLQAQRDFFGAHTYERIDKPRGQFFHTEWLH